MEQRINLVEWIRIIKTWCHRFSLFRMENHYCVCELWLLILVKHLAIDVHERPHVGKHHMWYIFQVHEQRVCLCILRVHVGDFLMYRSILNTQLVFMCIISQSMCLAEKCKDIVPPLAPSSHNIVETAPHHSEITCLDTYSCAFASICWTCFIARLSAIRFLICWVPKTPITRRSRLPKHATIVIATIAGVLHLNKLQCLLDAKGSCVYSMHVCNVHSSLCIT